MNINDLFTDERMAEFREFERDAKEERLKAIQEGCIRSVIADLQTLLTKHESADPVMRSMAMAMAADYLISIAELELDE